MTSKVAARHRSLYRITHTQRHLRATTQRLIKSVYLLSPTQIVVNYIELPPNAMALSSAACPSKRHLHSRYVKLSERQIVNLLLTHSFKQAGQAPASFVSISSRPEILRSITDQCLIAVLFRLLLRLDFISVSF